MPIGVNWIVLISWFNSFCLVIYPSDIILQRSVCMGNSTSRRMEDSDSRSRSEDGGDSDLAAILQYLIRRLFG